MSKCDNCSHNCCCKCYLKHCHTCRRDICMNDLYNYHYVCFNCKLGWKIVLGNRGTHDDTVNNAPIYRGWKYENKNISDATRCRKCKKEGINMGWNFRLPKKSDTKNWKLVEYITKNTYIDLEKMGPIIGTFQYLYIKTYDISYTDVYNLWMERKIGLYNTMHISKRPKNYYDKTDKQLKLWYPRHKREYTNFLNQIRSTKYIEKKSLWHLLRTYVKIRSIVNYWRMIAHKHKMKILLLEITVLPIIGKKFVGGVNYIEAYNHFNNT